ncbi:MAG: hypothetical protein ACRCYV_08565 [Aeromonas sp.]
MKKVVTLLAALLLLPTAASAAESKPAKPYAQTWHVAPIMRNEQISAEQVLTAKFTAQLLNAIKVNEYQTGKVYTPKPAPVAAAASGAVAAQPAVSWPKWLIRTQLISASEAPMAGEKPAQSLTFGQGAPAYEIIAELLKEGVLVARFGQGWRQPLVADTLLAPAMTRVNHRYAIGREAKAVDLAELAGHIGFEVGKVVARNGAPLPEKKPNKAK